MLRFNLRYFVKWRLNRIHIKIPQHYTQRYHLYRWLGSVLYLRCLTCSMAPGRRLVFIPSNAIWKNPLRGDCGGKGSSNSGGSAPYEEGLPCCKTGTSSSLPLVCIGKWSSVGLEHLIGLLLRRLLTCSCFFAPIPRNCSQISCDAHEGRTG